MKKSVVAIIALFCLSFLLLQPISAQQPDEHTLVIAQSVDAPSLDPSDQQATTTGNILAHLFATLYELTPDGQLVPYLAKSVSYSPDGTQLTFTLNDGLTCQDGEPLTAEDVAYTLQRAVDPTLGLSGSSTLLSSIGFKEARVDSNLVVTVVLNQYSPIALGTLAGVWIHCKDSYSKMTPDQAATSPIGSGPYKLTEWVRDDHMTLEKVPNFTLRTPYFDKIIFRVIPEASTQAAELIAGNVDIISNVVPDQADAINSSSVASVVTAPGTRRMYIGMDQEAMWDNTPGGKALKDPKVRIALQYAIDVPTICKTLLGTTCDRLQSQLLPSQGGPSLQPYTYDPKMAEQLLDAAGYPRGADGVRFELTLQAGQGRYLNDTQVVPAICQYLTDVGVKTTCDQMDFGNAFIPLYIKHQAGQLFFIGSGGSTWSAISNLGDLSSPTAVSNATEWSNPDYFAGWDKLAKTQDPAAQQQIVNDMITVFHNDPPWILLYIQPNFYGVSKRISWTPRADENIWTFDAKLAGS